MRRFSSVGAILALVLASPLRAGDFTWTGLSGASSINSNGNWSGNLAPNGSTANLIFGSSGSGHPNVLIDSGSAVAGLQFIGGSYTMTASSTSDTLTIGTGGITTSSGSSNTALLDSSMVIELGGDQTWNVDSSVELDVKGNVSGGNAITKNGNGTLYLSGNNDFDGGLTISSGTLRLNSNTAAGDGTLTMGDNTTLATGSASTLTLSNDVTLGNNVTLLDSSSSAKLVFDGTVTTTTNAATIKLGGGTSTPVFFNDTLSSQSGSTTITFTGGSSPGVAVLQGTTDNETVSGIVADNAAVVFTKGSALPHNTLQAANGGYIGMAGDFATSGSTPPTVLLGRITDPANFAGTIGFDTDPAASGANAFTGTFDLTNFTNANFLGFGTITSAVLDSNAVIIAPTGGVLRLSGLGSTSSHGTLTVSAPLLSSNTISSVIINNDANSYTNGAVVLTNASNNYTGGTQIQAGTLLVGSNAALGTGTISAPSGSSSPVLAASTSGIVLTNSITIGGSSLTVGVASAGNTLKLTGIISGSGALDVYDTTTLGGNNTFSGNLVVDHGAALTLGNNHATGTGQLDVANGTVYFNTATPVVDGLTGTSSGALDLGTLTSSVLTINQGTDATYSGTIGETSYSSSLIKAGSARLFLNGADTYTGTTTISGGTLIADTANALGTSAIVLDGGKLGVASGVTLTNAISFTANGGKLGGLGTFAPTSMPAIGTNVIIAPGFNSANGPGTITFGSAGLTLASGGTIHMQITSVGTGLNSNAGTDYDTIVINGALNITATSGSPFTIKPISLNSDFNSAALSDFNSGDSYKWLLATANSAITGFSPSDFTVDTSAFQNSLNGGSFSLGVGGGSGNELFLNFTPVPEPSEYLLMAAGLGIILLARRWRRRRRLFTTTAQV